MATPCALPVQEGEVLPQVGVRVGQEIGLHQQQVSALGKEVRESQEGVCTGLL